MNPLTEAEFVALLKPLELYLKRMALAITNCPEDAQDAVQEAVLAAFVARNQLRDIGQFKPWIKKIVAHHCGRQIQKRRRVIPMDFPESFVGKLMSALLTIP